MEQRGGRLSSESRRAPTQRTVATPLRKQRDKEGKACKQVCSPPLAGAADARQALAALAQGVQATVLTTRTVGAQPRYGKRGRPGRAAPPDQVLDQIEGALASALTARHARVDQHRCVILATNELDETPRPPHEGLPGDQGQGQAERELRFLQASQFLTSSLYRKKPARIMALRMVRTICLRVYAALESRIRKALKEHAATVPDQTGQRIQHPTARWGFHDCVGMHVVSLPQHWPVVSNLTAEHQHLRQLLGNRSAWLYRGIFPKISASTHVQGVVALYAEFLYNSHSINGIWDHVFWWTPWSTSSQMSRMEVWAALYETFLSQKRYSCRSWPVVIAKNRLHVPVPLERGPQCGMSD